MKTNWYVARTKYKLSSVAEQELSEQGFEIFSPRIRLTGADSSPQRMYPRYMFINCFPLVRSWRAISSTRGIEHLLPMHCESPSIIPDKFISELKVWIMDNDATEDENRTRVREIHVGDYVKTATGPFSDGKFLVKSVEKDIVNVEITILSNSLMVRLPKQLVVTVDQHS